MFFKKPRKLSAETLTDLKLYIDKFFPDETLTDEFAPCEDAAVNSAPDLMLSAEEPIDFAPSQAAHKKDTAAGGNFNYSAPAPPKLRQPKKSAKREKSTFAGGFMPCAPAAQSLADALEQIDESFAEMLIRKIDEKRMTDAQCYKKAQIDRKLFSKIRSQPSYRPSKQTALSFALALELTPEETRDLLMKAGYALSHSSKADIIVEYFISHKIYDKFLVNEALYEFDQPLL